MRKILVFVSILIVAILIFHFIPWGPKPFSKEKGEEICVKELFDGMFSQTLSGGKISLDGAREKIAIDNGFHNFEELNYMCVEWLKKYGEPSKK